MKIVIKDIIVGILICTVLFALVVALIHGLDKSEEVECYKLQDQSVEYPSFHLTKVEKQMCDFHGIKINAPVE